MKAQKCFCFFSFFIFFYHPADRQTINDGKWKSKFSWFRWTQMSALEYKPDQKHLSVFLHIFHLPISTIISECDRIRTLCLAKTHFGKSRWIPPLTCLCTKSYHFRVHVYIYFFLSDMRLSSKFLLMEKKKWISKVWRKHHRAAQRWMASSNLCR